MPASIVPGLGKIQSGLLHGGRSKCHEGDKRDMTIGRDGTRVDVDVLVLVG